MLKPFDPFRNDGMISVWIGNCASEEELDDYLSSEFENDFGFELYHRAVREIAVELPPVDIAKLVHGFSRSQTFASEIVAAAKQSGITIASSMFIIYFFHFDPSCVHVVSNPKLKFIGAIPFPGFA